MRVSCLCVCHNKPELTYEAIGSIVRQTFPNWEAIIVDSGVLSDAGYYERFPWRSDPRIKLIRSGETAETRRSRAMAPWCFNECFRRGLVTGELVMYLCDDDALYPRAFETFVSYCRSHPDAQAMYASQDLGVIYPNGWHAIVGERRALRRAGRSCGGAALDSQVDYLQLCHKKEVLKRFPGEEYWPEAKATEEHADGLFLERLGAQVPIHPIDIKVSQNRRTSRSTYTPLPSLAVLDCLANGVPLLPSQETADTGLADSENELHAPLVTVCVTHDDKGDGLAATLASLAAQTYHRLEVLVMADPSPALSRNRGLAQARGPYFMPLLAGHLASPDLIERLLERMRSQPRTGAVTCYVTSPGSQRRVGSQAMYRTDDLRAVGGFDEAHDCWGQEWSTYFRLVNSGRHVDLLPEHLIRTDAGEEADEWDRFRALDREWAGERANLWTALACSNQRCAELVRENQALKARLGLLRYRLADRLDALCARLPFLRRGLKRLFHAFVEEP